MQRKSITCPLQVHDYPLEIYETLDAFFLQKYLSLLKLIQTDLSQES